MRALVLSGGGSKGSWQVGALKYLAEIYPDGFSHISGTSVGAINAAGLAMFDSEDFPEAVKFVEKLWIDRVNKTTDIWKHRFPPYVAALWSQSVGNAAPLGHLLEEVVDPKKIRESNVTLRIPSVDLVYGKLKEYDENSKQMIDGIMASAAFPMFFGPIETEDTLELDGGLMDIAPLSAPIKMGADEIVVVLTGNPTGLPRKEKESMKMVFGIATRTLEIMTHEILVNDLKVCNMVNHFVENTDDEKKYVDLKVVYPRSALISPLDFSGDAMEEQIKIGYKEAKAIFANKDYRI